MNSLRGFTTSAHQRWNQAVVYTQQTVGAAKLKGQAALGVAQLKGQAALADIKTRSSQLMTNTQQVFDSRIRQNLWVPVKAHLTSNRLTVFYSEHPEVFNKKNGAKVTSSVAIPILIGTAFVLAAGIEILPLVALGGAFFFAGVNAKATRDIQQDLLKKTAKPKLDKLKQTIETSTTANPSIDKIKKQYKKLLDPSKRLQFMEEDLKSLEEQIKGLEDARLRQIQDPTNQDLTTLVDQKKRALIQSIEAIVKKQESLI